MAEAAAEVLVSQGARIQTLRSCQYRNLQLSRCGKYISEIIGRTVNYVSPTKETFISALAESGIFIPEEYISIILAQSHGKGDFTSGDLTKLLGRKPTSKQYLAQNFQA
ncbi:hypothetical protein J7E50_02965 [Pedobacter sp. ISL-68]|uniref:hypothetical protein n=1 Tax=unclassified Pedobacter TaxID=2628915 RepID=UPI001BEA1F1C|nr:MULTISPECIES: hypothetical protein [unclassified Pedobacter]MBT2560182.1 hypothetical protein [Pedobacter sp. ISL-64]MBT2589161.1 hypothetical protein [Pedobacter sp. ISL-68]